MATSRKNAASSSSKKPSAKQTSPRAKSIARKSDQEELKNTHPEAISQREPARGRTAAEKLNKKLDALPDRIDIRDWVYQPTLAPLPNRLINCHEVPAHNILDQGQEGACTGYALAAVINFLLARRGFAKQVSPRMLYELARKYDEWPGEAYEGSSARGGMKGWVRHGVCCEDLWSEKQKGLKHFTARVAREALQFPGGAFYRIMHRQVRDMHAALTETGILYCTLMVHSGWNVQASNNSEPNRPDQEGLFTEVVLDYDRDGNYHKITLPVIRRPKGERADSGHAVAIVGYTQEGFIIQNSWGRDWGANGFALLPYEDYLMHATDVWVAQLGVPVSADLWVEGKFTDTTAGLARVREAIRLHDIRPFIIDVGNNGELSSSGDYWTSEDDVKTLFTTTIPDHTKDWTKKRILLYLHGGLNSEHDVAQRVMAFRDVMLANEIYPVHIMWETGVMESIRSIIGDFFTNADDKAGGAVADWLKKFRTGLIEAKDKTFELTVAGLGSQLWGEMKENARLASKHPFNRGAMQIIARQAASALKNLPAAEKSDWEIHIVAHSAGSIFAGHALSALAKLGLPIGSIQLLAPAITVADFEALYAPITERKETPYPTLYLLSKDGELDDDVGPYGKSLLYLVSNAFEGRRGTPLLGMAEFVVDAGGKLRPIKGLRETVNGWDGLVIAGAGNWNPGNPDSDKPIVCKSSTHGGFDNDYHTLNSVLWRILGRRPTHPFELGHLQY